MLSKTEMIVLAGTLKTLTNDHLVVSESQATITDCHETREIVDRLITWSESANVSFVIKKGKIIIDMEPLVGYLYHRLAEEIRRPRENQAIN